MRTVAICQDCVYVCKWFARQNVYNMSLVGTKDKCQTLPSTPLTPTNILQGTLTIALHFSLYGSCGPKFTNFGFFTKLDKNDPSSML